MASMIRDLIFHLIIKFISQSLPHTVSNRLSARIAQWIGYDKNERKLVCQSITNHREIMTVDTDFVWHSYLRHKGIARSKIFHVHRLDHDWLARHVSIVGYEHVQAALQSGTGLLVMTYHHHYKSLIAALFGLMGYRTSVIAASPGEVPSIMRVLYHMQGLKNIESRLSGGKILYVTKKQGGIRSISRAIDDHQIVVTLNDVPVPATYKRGKYCHLFQHGVTFPTGSVELALKKKCPVVVAYLSWVRNDDFKLIITPINNSSLDTVFKDYSCYLETMIMAEPGLWEGWRWT